MAYDPATDPAVLKFSDTYLPGPDGDEPYNPRFDTAVDPRDAAPGWRTDEEVVLDLAALDLSMFTIDDVEDNPAYWEQLIGRGLNDAEQFWLQDIKLIELQRQNWGKQNTANKGDSSF